jgi:transposase InsO family protein
VAVDTMVEGYIKRWRQASSISWWQKQTGQSLKMFHTDRGGEFTSIEFAEYCVEKGVRRQLTAAYSPQQNGVVEHRN